MVWEKPSSLKPQESTPTFFLLWIKSKGVFIQPGLKGIFFTIIGLIQLEKKLVNFKRNSVLKNFLIWKKNFLCGLGCAADYQSLYDVADFLGIPFIGVPGGWCGCGRGYYPVHQPSPDFRHASQHVRRDPTFLQKVQLHHAHRLQRPGQRGEPAVWRDFRGLHQRQRLRSPWEHKVHGYWVCFDDHRKVPEIPHGEHYTFQGWVQSTLIHQLIDKIIEIRSVLLLRHYIIHSRYSLQCIHIRIYVYTRCGSYFGTTVGAVQCLVYQTEWNVRTCKKETKKYCSSSGVLRHIPSNFTRSAWRRIVQ